LSIQQLLLVITNGRQEVHARTLTSVCKENFAIHQRNQNRANETTITRLWLGKCRLNEYLSKLNITDSDKCVQCKTSAETVEHFLVQCSISDLCRKVVAACNSMGVDTDIK